MNPEEFQEIREAAMLYNEKLRQNPYDIDLEEYFSQLDPAGNGTMGYVEIPCINTILPIVHSTEDSVLSNSVGHVEWSSLPVGGPNTHAVLSGHRGLPSARLFTDLDKMVVGDLFMMRVLDEVLTYEVDQILIVEPHETDALRIMEGEDFCTLVTCTPYGVNSHRMLVRGHRVENQEMAETVRVTANATQIEPAIVAPILAIPMLLVLLIGLLIPKPIRRRFD
jgi:sortase A